MPNICDFDRSLKTKCNLQNFTRNHRTKNLDNLERDEADAHLWTAGLLNVKEKGMTIWYIMNRCLLSSVTLNFCYRQAHCIDDQDKFQSVTDTDNVFTECQTQRK